LTLGDNRKVDFSRAMIFMTSNLGAGEMSNLMNPKLGFMAPEKKQECQNGIGDEKLNGKINRTGVEAARRKFTPEFMNRLDKVVVFKPLGSTELKRILDIELSLVQQRIFSSDRAFVFHLTDSSKDFLLTEGTDMKYGARHLKRAIEKSLVQPMSNLMATDQIRNGDVIRIDREPGGDTLRFTREAESLPLADMAKMVDMSLIMPTITYSAGAAAELPRVQNARSSRRS
jgi:ATP-dependent Clp protease ATP-binding subunit ClpA